MVPGGYAGYIVQRSSERRELTSRFARIGNILAKFSKARDDTLDAIAHTMQFATKSGDPASLVLAVAGTCRHHRLGMYILGRIGSSSTGRLLYRGATLSRRIQEQSIQRILQSRPSRSLLFLRHRRRLLLLLRFPFSSRRRTPLPPLPQLLQRPRQMPRLHIPHILPQYRNPLLAPILLDNNPIPPMELIPPVQERRLVRHLRDPRLSGPQPAGFHASLPELLAEPAVALPSRAAGDEADAVDVGCVGCGVRAFVVAGAAFADGGEAAGGGEFVGAVGV